MSQTQRSKRTSAADAAQIERLIRGGARFQDVEVAMERPAGFAYGWLYQRNRRDLIELAQENAMEDTAPASERLRHGVDPLPSLHPLTWAIIAKNTPRSFPGGMPR